MRVVRVVRPAGVAGQYRPKYMVFKVPEDLKMWVKRPAGHYYLPLMFNVSAGITVNILRYPNPGVIGRHVHDGPVFSYTIEGAWYYPEHDWVAEAGTFIWEPPGEIHTLTVKESMMAFYVMHDPKSGVKGTSVSDSVNLGGRRITQKKKI